MAYVDKSSSKTVKSSIFYEILHKSVLNASTAIIVMDYNKSVLWKNKQAEKIIKQKNGFVINKGKIGTTSYAKKKCPLNHNIDKMKNCGKAAASKNIYSMFSIDRKNFNTPYYVKMLRLPGDDSITNSKQLILLHISIPNLVDSLSEGQIKQFFCLTKMESKIARLIAMGKDTKECETICKIKNHTMRTHLKNIYSKTGVKHRAQLVILIITAAPIMYEL